MIRVYVAKFIAKIGENANVTFVTANDARNNRNTVAIENGTWFCHKI